MGVFQQNLGGPSPFTPIDNTAKGRGVPTTITPASERGDVLAYSDVSSTAEPVAVAVSASNKDDHFLCVQNDGGDTPGTQAAAARGVPTVAQGLTWVKMRRNDSLAVAADTPLYCTQGQVWSTPVINAGASTSGRLFATLWGEVPAGGNPGDVILVKAVIQGAPPHLA